MAPHCRMSPLTLAIAATVLVTGCTAPAAQAPAPAQAAPIAALPADMAARARRGARMHAIGLDRATALRTGGPFEVVGSTVTLGAQVRDVIAQPSGFDLLLAVDGTTYLLADILRPAPVSGAAGYRVQQAAPVRIVGNAQDNRMVVELETLSSKLAYLRQEQDHVNRDARDAERELSELRVKRTTADNLIKSFVLTIPGAIARAVIDKQIGEAEARLIQVRARFGRLSDEIRALEADMSRAQAIQAIGGRDEFAFLQSLGEAEIRRRARAACGLWELERDVLARMRQLATEGQWPPTDASTAAQARREAESRALMVEWTTREKHFDTLRQRGLLQLATAADLETFAGGTRAAIVLEGGEGADTLVARPGVFRDGGGLSGGAGNDVIASHAPGGRLAGEGGDDVIFGSVGEDVLDGGEGDDVLAGRAGNDRLAGGDGADRLFGDGGRDTLVGDSGADRLVGGDGPDTLSGAAGDDVAFGGAGDDTLGGGDGLDRLEGGAGYDALAGGDGADALWGGDGDDALDGGAGDDALAGGSGLDRLTGAAGADGLYLEYAGEAGEGAEGDRTTTDQTAGALDAAGLSAEWRVANRWLEERQAVESALMAEEARHQAAAEELLP